MKIKRIKTISTLPPPGKPLDLQLPSRLRQREEITAGLVPNGSQVMKNEALPLTRLAAIEWYQKSIYRNLPEKPASATATLSL